MYPQRLHFLQHFFSCFHFFCCCLRFHYNMCKHHTLSSILHNAKKIWQFRFEIFRDFKVKTLTTMHIIRFWNTRSAVERKYTAPGREKNSWKYSSMTATEKLVLFTSALVQNWETKREAFAKNHESSLRWMKTAIALLCLGPVWRVGNCWKVGLTPWYVLYRVLA